MPPKATNGCRDVAIPAASPAVSEAAQPRIMSTWPSCLCSKSLWVRQSSKGSSVIPAPRELWHSNLPTPGVKEVIVIETGNLPEALAILSIAPETLMDVSTHTDLSSRGGVCDLGCHINRGSDCGKLVGS